ncbi:hypothetical protein ACFP56_17430 [Paenibacillus septentrionalis]|uniref:Uncharacterized protein n=1 Tax=Paenibacillus septentrionalis TaxID=429342 RepID=A0ABW1V8X0_9BACL
MPYYKSIEEDPWFRLQRRKQQTQSSIEQEQRSHMHAGVSESTRASSQKLMPQSTPQLTAFKSMTRIEQEWIAVWYEKFIQHEQHHLWSKFEVLSIGQKRSLLLDIAQTNQKPLNENSQPDWKDWQSRLEVIAEIPLQDQESFEEKRNKDAKPITSFYMMNQSDLLSPFREILLWLCYKGNHQGQQALLHSIDQLDINAKKLLILRLNGKQRCSSLLFSQQLTIVQHEQKVVDWDRIMQQLRSLHQLDTDQVQAELLQLESLTQSQSQMAPPNASHHMLIDEDGQDELDDHTFLNEEFASMDHDATTDTPSHMQKHGQAFEQEKDQLPPLIPIGDRRKTLLENLEKDVLALLGLLSNGNQRKAMKKEDFVDLCLKIPHNLQSTKREKARKKKIKSLNFPSLQHIFEFIINVISVRLYQDGVLKQDPAYIELLKALSLMKGGAIPSQESLTKQLLAHFES